jgi:hypothetical protein
MYMAGWTRNKISIAIAKALYRKPPPGLSHRAPTFGRSYPQLILSPDSSPGAIVCLDLEPGRLTQEQGLRGMPSQSSRQPSAGSTRSVTFAAGRHWRLPRLAGPVWRQVRRKSQPQPSRPICHRCVDARRYGCALPSVGWSRRPSRDACALVPQRSERLPPWRSFRGLRFGVTALARFQLIAGTQDVAGHVLSQRRRYRKRL